MVPVGDGRDETVLRVESRLRVGLFIVGAMRCGTTALWECFRKSPGVSVAQRKELHFFDQDVRFVAGANYDVYHALFHKKKGLLVDATPSYLLSCNAAERIKTYNPDAKIICIVRNPADRAYSHYCREVRLKRERRGFMDAVNHDFLGRRLGHPPGRYDSYLSRGFYSEQIERYISFFGENVLVLRTEAFFRSPEATLSKVSGFCGVSVESAIKKVRTQKRCPSGAKSVLMDVYCRDWALTQRLI